MRNLLMIVIIPTAIIFSFLTSCSEGDGDGGILGGRDTGNEFTITIDDAWITDFNDIDGDGYASTANLNWTITTTESADLVIYIGLREANSTGTYTFYKSATFSLSEAGSSSWYATLGNSGYEIPYGCYDILMQVFRQSDTENILTEWSASVDTDLDEVCMEDPEDDLVRLTFNNECHTEIVVDFTNYGSITIAGNSSNTFYFSSNPGVVYFDASTQIPVGGNLIWEDRSVDLTGISSETYDLWYGESIFYATIRNTGGSYRTSFYVNYGLEDQFFVDVTIPNDGVTRPLGYYAAHANTEIWCWSTGAQAWYSWSNLSFPGGNNQIISLSSTLAKTSTDFRPSTDTHKNQRYYIEAP